LGEATGMGSASSVGIPLGPAEPICDVSPFDAGPDPSVEDSLPVSSVSPQPDAIIKTASSDQRVMQNVLLEVAATSNVATWMLPANRSAPRNAI
jgi:hypothetical protein